MLSDDPQAAVPLTVRGSSVHLDTTVIIQQFKTPRDSQATKLALADFHFRSTSTYATHEFGRTWIRDLVYLYEASKNVHRPEELVGMIKKSFHGGPQSRLTRCLEIVERYLGDIPNTMPYGAVMMRLREHFSHAVLNAKTYFDRTIHHKFDGTGCFRATIHPSRSPDDFIDFTLPTCKRNNIRCRIHHFFREEQEKFTSIADAVERLGALASEQATKSAAEIRRAVEDPERLCEDKTCAKIGDALIGVDSEAVPVLAANNDVDWAPIATVLGKQLINPTRRIPSS
jgi:hypothetical protein